MAGSGPQRYPGASTAYWYQDDFGGDLMEVNVVVLHTTEGRTLPDYGGGASAPNLTAVPDFANKRLRWYQHFDIDRSSRALVNLSGGVETNTLNVVQVELVGTCDPATHTKWGTAQHVYWPQAPDWAFAGVADFLRWVHAQHGVPLTGPSKWPPYPTSYANGGGQRMTGSQWEAFKGVCGHMHVPENVHGDPGSMPMAAILTAAKGGTEPTPAPAPTPETGMDLSDSVNLTYKDASGATQLLWAGRLIQGKESISVNYALACAAASLFYVGEVKTGVDGLGTKVDALAAKVDSLAVGGVDLDALAGKVADLLAARLAD